MPTDYELDYAVKLEPEPKFHGLYPWAIQEFDEEGKQVGPDYIPFRWGVNFYASELRFDEGVSLNRKLKGGEESEEPEVKHLQRIRAKLRLGFPQEPAWFAPKLSYFGTARQLEDINLTVTCAEEGESEACWLGGGLAFGTGDGERFGDSLEIQMLVSPSTFEAFAGRIRERSVDIANLRISRAAGLYSEWTPEVRASHLKLLTDPENHHLDLGGAGSIEPRTAGVVKEAELWFRSLQTFHTAETGDEEDEPTPNYGVAVSMAPLPSAPQFETKEIAARLKHIGWLLTAILLVLLAVLVL